MSDGHSRDKQVARFAERGPKGFATSLQPEKYSWTYFLRPWPPSNNPYGEAVVCPLAEANAGSFIYAPNLPSRKISIELFFPNCEHLIRTRQMDSALLPLQTRL